MRMGMEFEDFKVGEVVELGAHTMSEEEMVAFARRYDPQPFHTDPEAAKRSIFGGLIASGWHTCSVLMRLIVETERRHGATNIGSPGVDTCRWLKPVRAGDTLRATREVLETWPSRSRPMGLVRNRAEMVNQRGEQVLELVGIGMYRRRDGGGMSGATRADRAARGVREAQADPPRRAKGPPRPDSGPVQDRASRWAAVQGPAYFEDVQVGDVMRFGRYEVTREEIVEFAGRFDPQPYHMDEEAARESLFGGLVASGWHTGSMFMRMVAEYTSPRLASQGAVGFDDLKWLKPVRPGDVLTVESTVTEKTESQRRPERGLVKIASRVLDQRDEPVMTLTSLIIFMRRV